MAKKTTTRKAGRPPAGRDGAHSSEYPVLSVRIPPAARRTLDTLRIALHQPAWHIVADALDHYANELARGDPTLRSSLALGRGKSK